MLFTEEPLIPRRDMSKQPIYGREMKTVLRRAKSSANVQGEAQGEAKEARKRARQKAKDMLFNSKNGSKSSSDHKRAPPTSSGESRRRRPVMRSQSADYGYGGLYCNSNNSAQRRSKKRSSKSSSTISHRNAVRSQSDSAFYFSGSSTCNGNGPSTSLPPSRAKSAKIQTIPQGPESFLSKSQRSKTERCAPKKPSRRQSVHHDAVLPLSESCAPRKPSRRQSIGETSIVSEPANDETTSSLHTSFISSFDSTMASQKSNIERCAPKMPKRRLSKNKSAKSVIDGFNCSIVIEYEWPGMESTSSTCKSQHVVDSSTAPRMPTRRMSVHTDRVSEVRSTESQDMGVLFSPQKKWRSKSALLEIGNESFASIGREYIFEDSNLLVLSPKKTPTKTKVLNSVEFFSHSAQLRVSDEMLSISATSSDSEDSFVY